jgi:integrase
VEGTKIGDRRLSELKPSEVQVGDREVPSAGAVDTAAGGRVLRSILKAAVADRLIASSPAIRLSLPRAKRERVVPLTVAEVQRLADAMPPRCRAIVVAQAGLGFRLGELLALRVQDVDFLHRTVRVEEQLSLAGTRVPVKTPSSRRTVPLPSVVADTLARHLAEASTRVKASDEPIFATMHGRPWRHDSYGSRTFGRAVRDAGLPAGTTSHSLRHHYASVLLAAGESVVAVAERLGHDNAQLVLTTYGHLMADTEDRTRRAVDDAWASDSDRAAAQVRPKAQ